MSNSDRLIWIDTETFGLDPEKDPILEVGIVITDLDLETIDERSVLVWESPYYDKKFQQLTTRTDSGAKYVFNMHQQSGLWTACMRSGLSVQDATDNIQDFLRGHGVGKEDTEKEPMCGSSVQFDRLMLEHQMPTIWEMFHYRNIDISTLKELCKRFNPRVYSLIPKKSEKHRVMPDLVETIAEASFYKDNFLWI
jgi:oligoribonuclease